VAVRSATMQGVAISIISERRAYAKLKVLCSASFGFIWSCVAKSSPVEAFRAGLGAFLGFFSGLCLHHELICAWLILVAPSERVRFFLFAVPNSPLAQPWRRFCNCDRPPWSVSRYSGRAGRFYRIALVWACITVPTCRCVHPRLLPSRYVAMSPTGAELGFYLPLCALIGRVLSSLPLYTGVSVRTTIHFRQFDDPQPAMGGKTLSHKRLVIERTVRHFGPL